MRRGNYHDDRYKSTLIDSRNIGNVRRASRVSFLMHSLELRSLWWGVNGRIFYYLYNSGLSAAYLRYHSKL